MREYIKMFIFIVALGVISAGVLIGVDALTNSRIEANKLREFQETILDANGTEYNSTNINEIFEEVIEVQYPEDESLGLEIFAHKVTGNISFRYGGNGLWGPIRGVLTVEEDFITIVNIVVLEQEETPGLGAVVGEKQFLARFVGKKFDPSIKIMKDPTDADNEIDQITGATGTSVAFEKILNETHNLYYMAYRGGGVLTEDEIVLKAILDSHNYDFTNDNRKIEIIFNENFKAHTSGDLTIYEHLATGSFSFEFITPPGINQGGNPNTPITGVLTLANDFETIVRIKVINHGEVWGAPLLEQESLDKAIGLSIKGGLFKHTDNPDGEIDGIAGVTVTPNVLNEGLKTSHAKYFDAFKELENKFTFTLEERVVYLNQYEITYNEETLEDVLTLFNENFNVITNNGRFFVTHKVTGEVTYTYTTEMRFGRSGASLQDVDVIVTLHSDLETVANIKVSFDEGTEWGKRFFLIKEVLDRAIGKNITEVIFELGDIDGTIDGSIDGGSSATLTAEDFNTSLQEQYQLFLVDFKGGK